MNKERKPFEIPPHIAEWIKGFIKEMDSHGDGAWDVALTDCIIHISTLQAVIKDSQETLALGGGEDNEVSLYESAKTSYRLAEMASIFLLLLNAMSLHAEDEKEDEIDTLFKSLFAKRDSNGHDVTQN